LICRAEKKSKHNKAAGSNLIAESYRTKSTHINKQHNIKQKIQLVAYDIIGRSQTVVREAYLALKTYNVELKINERLYVFQNIFTC
jgi:hypothetical protein